MKEMEACVIMTKAEWKSKVIAKGKLCIKEEKDSFVKGDVILHDDGKPYICIEDTNISSPIGHSNYWKAVIVQN